MGATAEKLKEKEFFDAIVNFDEDEKAQEYFYSVMDSTTGRKNRDGTDELLGTECLRHMLFYFARNLILSPGSQQV